MATPFVILFQERSGSTHLYSLLNSHPQVTCRAEDFTFDWYRPPGGNGTGAHSGAPPSRRKLIGFGDDVLDPTRADILSHLEAVFEQPTAANGFKFKHPNQTGGYPEVLEHLEGLGERLRVVYLDRENVVKRAVSKQVLLHMRQNDQRASLRNENLVRKSEYRPLRIDVDEAIRYARNAQEMRVALEAIVDKLIADNPTQVQQIQDGNTKVIGWFVGQVMKATQGKANPGLVNQILKGKLGV